MWCALCFTCRRRISFNRARGDPFLSLILPLAPRAPTGMRQKRNASVLPGLLSQMPDTCPAVYTVAMPGALPVDKHARYGRILSLCHRGHERALAWRSLSRMLTDGESVCDMSTGAKLCTRLRSLVMVHAR